MATVGLGVSVVWRGGGRGEGDLCVRVSVLGLDLGSPPGTRDGPCPGGEGQCLHSCCPVHLQELKPEPTNQPSTTLSSKEKKLLIQVLGDTSWILLPDGSGYPGFVCWVFDAGLWHRLACHHPLFLRELGMLCRSWSELVRALGAFPGVKAGASPS